jgi:hypothetical protein
MGPLDSKVSPNLPVQLALAACASSSSARQWRMREVLIHKRSRVCKRPEPAASFLGGG